MPLTQDTIPNFIGGVSQQPDKLMFPNQSKKLLNMLPDPTIGLTKRKPTEHIARLMNTLPIQPQVYTVNKEDEKYQVFLTGTTVRVFDLEGNEKIVKYEVGEGLSEEEKEAKKADLLKYITTNTPIKDLQMDNIGDYTFILNKTVLGYELKAVGYNRFGAEYAGMPVNRNIVISMMIAGGLAGLAGVAQYMGNSAVLQIGVMPAQGFDGIAVALLGNNSPFGVLLSALFFGVLYVGKGFMNANVKVPPELADTIIATIIYFAATSVVMDKLIKNVKKKREDKKLKTTSERAVEK